MTNAEAIKYLKSKLDGKTDSSWEWTEVVRLAINALEKAEEEYEDTMSYEICYNDDDNGKSELENQKPSEVSKTAIHFLKEGATQYSCSECYNDLPETETKQFNFCPWCGATFDECNENEMSEDTPSIVDENNTGFEESEKSLKATDSEENQEDGELWERDIWTKERIKDLAHWLGVFIGHYDEYNEHTYCMEGENTNRELIMIYKRPKNTADPSPLGYSLSRLSKELYELYKWVDENSDNKLLTPNKKYLYFGKMR